MPNNSRRLLSFISARITTFEKSGTLVNQSFLIQKFAKAVPGKSGATDDLAVLAKLVAAAGGTEIAGELKALWKTIAAEVPALATMSFSSIPNDGLLLDSTPFADLPFVEGETLHYQPAAAAETTA